MRRGTARRMVCDRQTALYDGTYHWDRTCLWNGDQYRHCIRRFGSAKAKIIAKSVLRYVVVVIVFFLMMKWNLGNLITAFIGVLGLKVSAYLQPFIHKAIAKLQEGDEVSSDKETNHSA